QGKCNLCGKSFSKQAMTRHLDKCRQEHPQRGDGKQRVIHLQIQGADAPEYWLHVEAPANASLQTLDRFLRDIWLECCGHLSMFTIAGQVYDVAPEPDPFSGRKPKGMSAKLGDVLAPGLKFTHEYDFGTTTELALQVVGERPGVLKSIAILARNDPPAIPCAQCGKPATQVCSMCVYQGPQAWLCEEHAAEHECGEDYFLPVVNSPRVGMCGYTGGA
ncbi:MAG: plasmid pRiA4b ORF-3 family protein, partial [Anaerolineales bacterium]|nr:plasmid pRiA4b ORF-3 family protein [Anaerolineales bacterium]